MHSTTQGIRNVAAAASRAWRAVTAVIAKGDAKRPDPLAALLPAGVPRYVREPQSSQALARIGTEERVLVLGTGSAAADVVGALGRQRHRGLIRLVSRSALMPQRLAALRGTGRVEVWAGRVQGAASYGDTFVVDILTNGRTLHSSERYDWIVDCT